MNPPRRIRLERDGTDQQWGFHLQGGTDFTVPLSINFVAPYTVAESHGLGVGDQIIAINGRNVTNITQQDAKMEITRSGNELELTIIRGAISKRALSTARQIVQNKNVSVGQKPTSQIVRSNFIPSNQPQYHVSSNHNRGPLQQDGRKDNYSHTAPEQVHPKDSNFEESPAYNRDPLHRGVWKPIAYRNNSQSETRQYGTAVYHAQYNSPIGLYSDDKVLEAFKSQTGNLINEIKGNTLSEAAVNSSDNFQNKPSPTYQAVMNIQPQNSFNYSSEARLSRSFRVLEQDLLSVEGTQKTPKSIYDQRRQHQE